MFNTKLLPLAMLALSHSAFAQTLPNAGSQLQQIPSVPLQQRAPQKIEIQRGAPPATPATDTATILVNRLNLTGVQVYPESDLIALTGFRPGTELNLSALRSMASRITEHYRSNGYFVAQAYIPEQDIKDGIVTIAVIEGRYGNITLQNQSNLSNGQAHRILDGLKSGDLITTGPLENRLLLLSDTPGVLVKSTLAPGATVGTSDLIVSVQPGKLISGSIDADNAGNRYTGEYRLGATINLNNLAGQGDVASLRVLTAGSGLNYARASYQMQFGRLTAGAAYSYLKYSLGREFESLGATGTAQIGSLYASYPLIRTRDTSLYARVGYDDKTLQDKVASTSSVTDKKLRSLTGSLAGEHRDNIGGGGVSGFSLAWTTGKLDIQTPAVRAFDNLTARSNGHFNKVGYGLSRLQSLGNTFSLYGAVNGQMASKNLDASEKMDLGGMYGVRAYPTGEASADEGFLVNLEARMLVPKFSETMPGQLQLIAFIDHGEVKTNRDPWAAGNNRRNLSGAGVGANWTLANNFMVRAYYARKAFGSGTAQSAPDTSGRFWIQAVKYF